MFLCFYYGSKQQSLDRPAFLCFCFSYSHLASLVCPSSRPPRLLYSKLNKSPAVSSLGMSGRKHS